MSTDDRMRSAQRSSDVESRVRLLRARERRGDVAPWECPHPFPRLGQPGLIDELDKLMKSSCPACQGTGRQPLRRAIDLAAYCGDEAALQLIERPSWAVGAALACTHPTEERMHAWVLGLEVWPKARLRAELGACWAWAQPEGPREGPARRRLLVEAVAYEAAEAYANSPTPSNARSLCEYYSGLATPPRMLCESIRLSVTLPVLESVAEDLGWDRTAERARHAVIEWALA